MRAFKEVRFSVTFSVAAPSGVGDDALYAVIQNHQSRMLAGWIPDEDIRILITEPFVAIIPGHDDAGATGRQTNGSCSRS